MCCTGQPLAIGSRALASGHEVRWVFLLVLDTMGRPLDHFIRFSSISLPYYFSHTFYFPTFFRFSHILLHISIWALRVIFLLLIPDDAADGRKLGFLTSILQ